MKSKTLDRVLMVAAISGILISTYALYVEMTADAHPEYEAMCDIAEHISCSKVLTSEYAKGFGIVPVDSPFAVPNCIYGIVFYCLMIFMTTFNNLPVVRLQFFLAITSVASCFYLGYLLMFVLHDFCIVCVSTYVVNTILVMLINKKKNLLSTKNK